MGCSERKIASMHRIVFLLCLSSVFACKPNADTSLPYYNTPSFDPIFITDTKELTATIPHQIDDFTFTNQRNEPVTQKEIEGKIHVANFIFTSCGSICPKMTHHMKRVNDTFANDNEVVLLSYSVTPWIDNVERLNEYAHDNDINSRNWHLLTGNKAKIYELARKSYFAEEDMGFTKDSTEFLHTEHFLLVDASKRIRGIYNGTLQLEIEQLISDIKQLKNERM
jgi:protein SCO1